MSVPTNAWRWAKPLLFIACLLPLLRCVWWVLSGHAINPLEFITRSTGTWALVWLLASLAVSPLRQLPGLTPLLRLRRMLGLYAFFYACLHLLTYLWFDQFFAWSAIVHDIGKRPFITVGFATWLLLLPLAITSTDAMMRRLRRRWQRLHRLVYLAAPLAVLHYLWLVKKDLSQPLLYGAVLLLLLGWRLWARWLRPRLELWRQGLRPA